MAICVRARFLNSDTAAPKTFHIDETEISSWTWIYSKVCDIHAKAVV